MDPVDEYDSPYIYVGNAPTIAVDSDGSKTDWLTVGNGSGTSYFGHTGTRPVKHNPNEPWWLSAPVYAMTFVTVGIPAGFFALETGIPAAVFFKGYSLTASWGFAGGCINYSFFHEKWNFNDFMRSGMNNAVISSFIYGAGGFALGNKITSMAYSTTIGHFISYDHSFSEYWLHLGLNLATSSFPIPITGDILYDTMTYLKLQQQEFNQDLNPDGFMNPDNTRVVN